MPRKQPPLLPLRLLHQARGGAPARGISDARLVALARAACAPKAPLRRPFLRGRWHAAHVDRVAAAVAALGAEQGDLDPDGLTGAQPRIAERLRHLLAAAPLVADGLNSLAEFLGGRAASHADRLALVPRETAAQTEAPATPSAA